MSKFILKIDLGNAAFDEPGRDGEIARILRDAARKAESGYTKAELHDINGNTVGDYKITKR